MKSLNNNNNNKTISKCIYNNICKKKCIIKYILQIYLFCIFSHKDKFVKFLEPINNGILHYINKISQSVSNNKMYQFSRKQVGTNLRKYSYVMKIKINAKKEENVYTQTKRD